MRRLALLLVLAIVGCGQSDPSKLGFVSAGGGFLPPTSLGGGGTTYSAGTGLQLVGSTFSANLAGGTCTAGQAATALSSAGAVTCGNVGRNDYAGTHLEWTEEFMSPISSANIIVGPFQLLNIGGGAAGANGTTTRPGILDMTTSASATGETEVQTSISAIDYGSYTSTEFDWTGGWPTLSTSAQEYTGLVGYFDVATANAVDGCYFLYDRGNVATGGPNSGNTADLSCWCCVGSVCTKYLMDGSTVSDESFTTVLTQAAAATLPNTAIYTLAVKVTGATRAEFYADTGGGLSKRCDINTHIPSGASNLTGAGFQLLKSVGTVASHMYTDRARLVIDMTAARSP